MKSSKMLAQNAFFKMKSTWAKDIDKKNQCEIFNYCSSL